MRNASFWLKCVRISEEFFFDGQLFELVLYYDYFDTANEFE